MKYFIIFTLSLFFCFSACSESKAEKANKTEYKSAFNTATNTYSSIKDTKTKSSSEETPFLYEYKDSIYTIYISKNGNCFIEVISKKGNKYKKYLDKEISKDVCMKLNRDYNGK